MDQGDQSRGGIFGFSEILTSLKNIVTGINNLSQNVKSAFPAWTTGQIPGTTTNGDATAGNIGEYISSNVDSGAAVALVSATAKTVTSINLTAGDWDVWGTVGFIANAATTATAFSGGVNTATNTLPTDSGSGAAFQIGLSVGAGGVEPILPVGARRITLSAPATVYLVAQSTFAVNAMSAFGFIASRRRR